MKTPLQNLWPLSQSRWSEHRPCLSEPASFKREAIPFHLPGIKINVQGAVFLQQQLPESSALPRHIWRRHEAPGSATSGFIFWEPALVRSTCSSSVRVFHLPKSEDLIQVLGCSTGAHHRLPRDLQVIKRQESKYLWMERRRKWQGWYWNRPPKHANATCITVSNALRKERTQQPYVPSADLSC